MKWLRERKSRGVSGAHTAKAGYRTAAQPDDGAEISIADRAPASRADPSADALPRRQLPTRGTRILSVSHATKRFGGLVAVNDVSFDVDAGEIVGLIGPNGAGKTTMFNLLTCTLPMTSGSATFLGHDIDRATQRVVARLGLARTFQHVKLRPQMSLLDNVALGAHARTRAGVLQAGLRLDRT